MKLYIEAENGQVKNHPAFEDNLLHAFGSIPAHWEPFERVERPVLGVYEKLESQEPTYQKVDGAWKDVWVVRSMTAEEKTAKQQAAKDEWAKRPNASNFTAWTFDDATCVFVPLTPYPFPVAEGEIYSWSGADNKWKLVPAQPEDGKNYTFSTASWTWTESAV